MKLTEAQDQTVREDLQRKWQGGCSKCGGTSLNIDSTVYGLREYQEGNMVIGGSIIAPVIAVACGNCGNISLVSATALGVVI